MPGLLTNENMFTTLTQNWNVMRIIRLVIGGYALIEAYRGNDTLMGLLGLVAAAQVLVLWTRQPLASTTVFAP
jgi:hypothetical protein